MVLDALIRSNDIDITLPFGVPAAKGLRSCAMNIDGTNTLACIKSIDDVKGDVKIYPLPHMDVVKDLVPDLQTAYAQYASIKPWLQDRNTAAAGPRTACNRRKIAPSSMGYTNVFSVSAVRRAAQATGGMATVTSVLPPCSSLRWLVDSRDEADRRRLDELARPISSFIAATRL